MKERKDNFVRYSFFLASLVLPFFEYTFIGNRSFLYLWVFTISEFVVSLAVFLFLVTHKDGSSKTLPFLALLFCLVSLCSMIVTCASLLSISVAFDVIKSSIKGFGCYSYSFYRNGALVGGGTCVAVSQYGSLFVLFLFFIHLLLSNLFSCSRKKE